MLQGAKIRNLGAAIWRAILNIIFLLTKVCVWKLLSHLPTII